MFLAALGEQRSVRSVALSEREVDAVVAVADRIAVASERKPLGSVRANRLEHMQPGRCVCPLSDARSGS